MRRVKHILINVLVLCMCFTLFFMPKYIVYADSATYKILSPNCYLGSFINANNQNFYYSLAIRYESRILIAYDSGQTKPTIWIWNEVTQDNSYILDGSNVQSSCRTSYTGDGYTILNNKRYYYYHDNSPNNVKIAEALGSPTIICSDIPSNSSGSYNYPEKVVNYVYGSNAVDPAPPGPTYGRVADVEYATRIAGSGLASGDNIDRIVWNQSVDTNGNDLPTGARVQIRAVPGKYVGNTANEVLTKTYTDFVLDHSKQLIIVDIIASRGVYETKWSEVVDHFGFFPYSWVPNIQYLDNEYFKMGWIYQIRLQVDDYYSDWVNIYTATGSGASESQTITDSDELSQQLVQDINIVNQLNNTTTTNWYINETTINNSEYTENTNGKPWWAYLLEAILSLFQIGDGEQQTINNTNNLNVNLNDKLNEYNEIEDQQLNNLDTNLEAIEVESDMLENNKFVGSANWVAQQYTRITNGTVIGSLIGFSLLFGLALIFIGKIR